MSWSKYDHGLQMFRGDALEMLRYMKSNSVSGVVTDPPYGISFLSSKWDYELPDPDIWRELHRVCKPGAYIVVFSSTRTIHRLGVDLEDAGFQPRDLIGWVTYQGFPKSHDISQALDKRAGAEREVIGLSSRHGGGQGGGAAWEISPEIPKITAPSTPEAKLFQGYGTALKPAQEPALLMRKAPEGTLADNVMRWGTGGLNIDRCRFRPGDPAWIGPQNQIEPSMHYQDDSVCISRKQPEEGFLRVPHEAGRWPANLYQCPKVSRREREEYTQGFEAIAGADAVKRKEGSAGIQNPRAGASRGASEVRNSHPTVKPRQLMRWLLRLVAPPERVRGPILDPFLGSGTTLLAGLQEGISVWGSEREAKYQDLIHHRLMEATRQGSLF
jgi:DNA modification methylase